MHGFFFPCENGSYMIQGVYFYQFHNPVVHAESFRINISITAMHILTARVLGVSNDSHNRNVPIHERVCVIPPPYYLELFEKYYPNFPLTQHSGPFFLQFMNEIQF